MSDVSCAAIGLACLLASGCDWRSEQGASNATNCAAACDPNPYVSIVTGLGKVTCTCDVRTDGGVVRQGTAKTSHYFEVCQGRAIRRVSETMTGENVECAP